MGVLTGRLHGYDQEDAIKQLVTSRLKKRLLKLPKVDNKVNRTEDWNITANDGSTVQL